MDESLVDIQLSCAKKSTTNKHVYLKKFLDIKDNLLKKKFSFLYTDGSKNKEIIGLAVTTEEEIVKQAVLPTYSSVYTAEAIAILEAVRIAEKKRGKTCICSDSLSTLEAVLNCNNMSFYTTSIRDLIIKLAPKIMLLWVPSHIGIKGNECADTAAKDATRSPLISIPNLNRTDINKLLKTNILKNNTNLQQKASPWYQAINPEMISINEYAKNAQLCSLPRKEITKIIRLRLGHTKLTHEYRFSQPINSQCRFCTTDAISISHILNDCTAFQTHRPSNSNKKLSDLLINPSYENLQQILNFLKSATTTHLNCQSLPIHM